MPDSYQKFTQTLTAECFSSSAVLPVLELTLIDRELPKSQLVERICQVEIWEIWHDPLGRIVFFQPRETPPRWVVVDQDFQVGEVWGNFSPEIKAPFYPLQYIDIVLFANWLARYDDLILHAAGIAIDERGYAFIGASGWGKSTLVANLPQHPNLTILGDDQIILRYFDGHFWIFGTPWHLNPDFCSPLGVPLEKIFFLNRNIRQPVSPEKAINGITQLMQTAFIPYYRLYKVESLLNRLATMAENTPLFTLSYQLGTDILTEILAA